VIFYLWGLDDGV